MTSSRDRSINQINFFTKIIGTTLIVFGTISAIVQIVKIFIEPDERYTAVFALVISVCLIFLGTKKVLVKLIDLTLHYRTVAKVIIFLSPIFLSLFFLFLRLFFGYEAWRGMNTEGGFIEYGTSLAFILAAIFAFPMGKFFIANKNKILGYLYYFLGTTSFFVGMEEISWGQKLLGFESSEFFQNYNSQEEITLHNLVWVNNYLDKGLMFVALIAGLSCLSYKFISKAKNNYRAKFILPRWFLASFFLIVALFFYLIEYVVIWNSAIATFQESVELIFSLGYFMFILTNFFAMEELKVKSSKIVDKKISTT